MTMELDRQKLPLKPVQKRSRERSEHILSVAEEMLLEPGNDSFRMSDLVARSGVPIGSLYQYFPSRSAVIGALADRHNEVGRRCVEDILAPVGDLDAFLRALDDIVDGFYQMFRDYPVMKPIWEATQSDAYLKSLDEQDVHHHSMILLAAYRRAVPQVSGPEAEVKCRLVNELMASAVRQAVRLDQPEALQSLTLFKKGIKAFFV